MVTTLSAQGDVQQPIGSPTVDVQEIPVRPRTLEPLITEENVEQFEPLQLPAASSMSTRVQSPPRGLIAETTGRTARAATDTERALEYLNQNPGIVAEVKVPKITVERLKEIARGLHIKGISATKEPLRGKILAFLESVQNE